VVTHFNTIVSTFRGWFQWIVMRPLEWWIGLRHCPLVHSSCLSLTEPDLFVLKWYFPSNIECMLCFQERLYFIRKWTFVLSCFLRLFYTLFVVIYILLELRMHFTFKMDSGIRWATYVLITHGHKVVLYLETLFHNLWASFQLSQARLYRRQVHIYY